MGWSPLESRSGAWDRHKWEMKKTVDSDKRRRERSLDPAWEGGINAQHSLPHYGENNVFHIYVNSASVSEAGQEASIGKGFNMGFFSLLAFKKASSVLQMPDLLAFPLSLVKWDTTFLDCAFSLFPTFLLEPNAFKNWWPVTIKWIYRFSQEAPFDLYYRALSKG